MAKKVAKKKVRRVNNSKTDNDIVRNSLDGALFRRGQMMGSQVSQWDTIFKDARWYLISNNRQLISEAYAEYGLVQTVVDLPVDDGFRGGIDIKSKHLDEDDIKNLKKQMEYCDDIEEIKQSRKWNRLYGGAGLLIMTDQDPSTPLDVKKIKKDSKLEFRAIDMWEMFYGLVNTDTYDSQLQEHDREYFDYYGIRTHRSRILILKGIKPPSFLRPRLRGWGFSVLEAIVRSINQYLKSTDLTFEVLDEFKLDIFRFDGLANMLMSAKGEERVHKRVATANQGKNYQNAIVLDKNDEYEQKQLSFTGLSDVMSGIRMQLASDLRIPLTKLFGVSAAGFNSGEDDIENYNGMIDSQIRSKSTKDILRVISLRCQQMFGFVPDDLEIEFKPLRVMSSEQEENVKTQKFNRLLAARQAGEITTEEFREAVNNENLLPIKLEASSSILSELEGEDEEEASTVSAPTKKSTTQAKEAKV